MQFLLRCIAFLLTATYSFHIFGSTVQTFKSSSGNASYLNGNYVGAIKRWIELGNKGEAEAQLKLGTIYRLGENGIEKDINKSIKWYTLAAEKGNVYAQYNLGKIYESEKDIIDYKKAAKWYLLGAEKGNAFSQLKLGLLYAKGQGVPLDLKYAHKQGCDI